MTEDFPCGQYSDLQAKACLLVAHKGLSVFVDVGPQKEYR